MEFRGLLPRVRGARPSLTFHDGDFAHCRMAVKAGPKALWLVKTSWAAVTLAIQPSAGSPLGHAKEAHPVSRGPFSHRLDRALAASCFESLAMRQGRAMLNRTTCPVSRLSGEIRLAPQPGLTARPASGNRRRTPTGPAASLQYTMFRLTFPWWARAHGPMAWNVRLGLAPRNRGSRPRHSI